MKKTNKLLLAICSIITMSCNTNSLNENNQVPKIGKIENLTEKQVYEKFEVWLKDAKNNHGEIINDIFKVILTDVNNDGFLDGLIDFNDFVPKDGNAEWNLGYPYFENTENGLKYITTLNGDLPSLPRTKKIEFISNVNGVITVKAIRFKKEDANCCPSIEREEIYTLNDTSFVLKLLPKTNWKYLELTFLECRCFEGDECGFVFKNSEGKVLNFQWYLNSNSEQNGSYEDDFMSRGYNDTDDRDSKGLYYNKLAGKKVRVYFDGTVNNPGKCKDTEDGLSCTEIKMLELIEN
jgi:hypothetical protein